MPGALTYPNKLSDAYKQLVFTNEDQNSGTFDLFKSNTTLAEDDVTISTLNVNIIGTVTGAVSGNAGSVTEGVYKVSDQTIGGIKTFSETIIGNIQGDLQGNVGGDITGQVLTASQTNITGIPNLATVGTISTGVWRGTDVGDDYIESAATWNNKIDKDDKLTNLVDLTRTASDQIIYSTGLNTYATGTLTAQALVILTKSTLTALRDYLKVDIEGTDNSTNVTITGNDYLGLLGQVISASDIDLESHVSGDLPDGNIASSSVWNAKLDSDGTIDENDYARFDASGDLIGRTYAEVRSDLGIGDDEIVDWTTDQGATNIHSGNYINTEYDVFDNDNRGIVPDPGSTGTTTKYLREDGSFQIPPDTNTQLTLDAIPTDGNAANAVSSDGVFDALALKASNASLGDYSLTLLGLAPHASNAQIKIGEVFGFSIGCTSSGTATIATTGGIGAGYLTLAPDLSLLIQLDDAQKVKLYEATVLFAELGVNTLGATGDYFNLMSVAGYGIQLDTFTGTIQMTHQDAKSMVFDVENGSIEIYDPDNISPKFVLDVNEHSATSITTTDAAAGTALGHITIDPDGDLILKCSKDHFGDIKLLYDDDTTFIPSLDENPATKAYVDTGDAIIDEDDFASDSAFIAPSQQSVKAYVDAKVDLKDTYTTQTAGYYIRMTTLDKWYVNRGNLGSLVTPASFEADGTGVAGLAIHICNAVEEVSSIRCQGQFSSTTDYEVSFWQLSGIQDGDIDGTANATVTQIGDTYQFTASLNRWYNISIANIGVHALAVGDTVFAAFRYTSGSGSKTSYQTIGMDMSRDIS